jgi:hypothetical protein
VRLLINVIVFGARVVNVAMPLPRVLLGRPLLKLPVLLPGPLLMRELPRPPASLLLWVAERDTGWWGPGATADRESLGMFRF